MSISTLPTAIKNDTYGNPDAPGQFLVTTSGVNGVTTISGSTLIVKSSTLGEVVRIDETGLLIKDGITNRLAAGLYNGIFKIKLSQTGNDVLTASDDKMIWDSDFNSFKIGSIVTGTITGQPANNGEGGFTFAHNLGYIPTVVGTFNLTGTPSTTHLAIPYFYYDLLGPNFEGELSKGVWLYGADSTNVYLTLFSDSDSGGLSFFNGASVKFYCLRETSA